MTGHNLSPHLTDSISAAKVRRKIDIKSFLKVFLSWTIPKYNCQVQVDRFIFGLFQQIQLSVLLLFTRFYASHRFSLSAFVLSFAVPSYSEPTQKGNDKCIRVSIQ